MLTQQAERVLTLGVADAHPGWLEVAHLVDGTQKAGLTT
ncbi:hypothetical protein UO65_5277 [Actinokineospora spheciospongiae]|uniref:Uncharacterized protein n=1 Tax=Actinokineospora spheciospongiae TaxID=909613 RepID=W7ISL2_9PSEU|nr:hypothetical protein UO65_5277 [Actinokineospora spheciospongiae]